MLYKMKISFFCLVLFIFYNTANAQHSADDLNQNLLLQIIRGKDSTVDHVLNKAEKYHFQLILTLVDQHDGKDELLSFDFNQDKYYYNPASLIKLPVVILAAEKMSRLKETFNVSVDDRIGLQICSCDKTTEDYINRSIPSTFRQVMRETIIMSSNPGFNYFFNFLGRDSFNTRIKDLGYSKTNLRRRFYANCTESDQSRFGGVNFYDEKGRIKHSMKCYFSNKSWENNADWPHLAGLKHKENGKYVNGPKDYRDGNFLALSDAHGMMLKLFNPEKFDPRSNFQIDSSIKNILIDALGNFPRELNSIHYKETYPDYYYKFFLDPKTMNTADGELRIYNKVGIAGGFISDVSFFHDKRSGIKFYLSGAMLAKKDGIMDNGKYDYYDIGIPVFRKIGSMIYAYLSGSIGTDNY